MSLSFAKLGLDEALPPVEADVTQDVIDLAAVAHLDFNPVHTNLEWSRRAKVFGTEKTVAHGMFTLSLMASVIDRPWRDSGARIEAMDSTFTRPVPVGRHLECTGRIIELHPIGPGRNFVVIAVTARDDEGETVAVASFRVSVPD